MIEWIKQLYYKIKFKFFLLTHEYRITARGEAILNYILNKYINATKSDDFIENYEDIIFNTDNEFLERAYMAVQANPKAFTKIGDVDTCAKLTAHIFSAMRVFETILTAAPSEDRARWLNRIEDMDTRNKMSKRIEKRIKII